MTDRATKMMLIISRYLLVFILLSIVIGVTGYCYFINQRTVLVREREGILSSIADLKVSQIVLWRKERMGDASVIYDNQIIANRIKDYREGKEAFKAKNELITWMMSLKSTHDYDKIRMYTPEGVPLLSLPNDNTPFDLHHQTAAKNAADTRKIFFDDFHKDDKRGEAHLTLIVPVLYKEIPGERCIAVMILDIAPQTFLYPLIQSWPIQSKTAESLLVRREGDTVLFLNELRHRKNSAFAMRLPVSSEELPAARAIRGQQGIFEGRDYRGVRVLSALRTIPGSPWALVSKIDVQEINDPIKKRALYIMIIVFCAITTSGLMTHLWWSRQRMEYLNNQYEAEHKFNEELEQRVKEQTADLSMMVKKMERETAQRIQTLENLREKERIMVQQSRQAAMGEMISNIAHQWRQPLHTLGMLVQRVQLFHEIGKFNKDFLDSSTKESMRLIGHMSGTIDNFRNFFKPDKEMVSFNVNETVRQAICLVEANFKHQKISLTMDEECDLQINGYPNEYSQVLLNILLNARDVFAERVINDAQITFKIIARDDTTVVTITDNAGGIPEEIMDKIFDPHFTTKGPQGTGIGLYMAKNIIERNMNGRLTARNTGNGAEFIIEV